MKLFPNLTHIELFGSYTPTEEFLSVLGSESLPSLCSLLLDRSSMSNFSAAKLLENKAVLQLNRLELKQFTFSDNLSALLSEGIHFPKLVKLGLINCKLTRYDVGCLAQASVEGIFPQLAELDVSQNNDACVTQDLFDLDCRWEKLTSLNVEGRGSFLHLTQNAVSGCLTALEELRFSTENPNYLPLVEQPCFPKLKVLKISSQSLQWKQMLSPLANLFEWNEKNGDKGRGFLKSLESVTLCLPRTTHPCLASERQSLRRNGVRVYLTTQRSGYW